MEKDDLIDYEDEEVSTLPKQATLIKKDVSETQQKGISISIK